MNDDSRDSNGLATSFDNEIPLEVYRQACENSRTYANSRFSNLSAFVTYLSILAFSLAFLLSSETAVVDARRPAALAIALLGSVVAFLFLALEVRHHYYWEHYERVAQGMEVHWQTRQVPSREGIKRGLFRLRATWATVLIYVASLVFFPGAVPFVAATV